MYLPLVTWSSVELATPNTNSKKSASGGRHNILQIPI